MNSRKRHRYEASRHRPLASPPQLDMTLEDKSRWQDLSRAAVSDLSDVMRVEQLTTLDSELLPQFLPSFSQLPSNDDFEFVAADMSRTNVILPSDLSIPCDA